MVVAHTNEVPHTREYACIVVVPHTSEVGSTTADALVTVDVPHTRLVPHTNVVPHTREVPLTIATFPFASAVVTGELAVYPEGTESVLLRAAHTSR